MNRYFIRHFVKPGDITHLSDRDSGIIIEKRTQKEEDYVEIQSDQDLFLAQITFIDKASVEVEIIKPIGKVSHDEDSKFSVTLIQAIGADKRFNFILEKSTELGISRIIPVVSELSPISLSDAKKNYTKWVQIIDQSRIQSRNPNPPQIDKPLLIEDLTEKKDELYKDTQKKICLSSEVLEKGIFSKSVQRKASYVIAVGPEKGWSLSDIEVFKKLGFSFVTIGKNILRMETAGIVATSIINFVNDRY
jgi:16S rRNA (uracil1498-N3)-methyltransferase